ncbi:hypothetical protein TREMEDRAFT_66667 [Tremella mesenterica DSM 1558]|uniref:uncharacterized protein n=1 Tax=Tremella mesenterica (strain ATCC 24925 / CBS 8224 / DSM 1558 / NBRC 9311 / NRRL Y-6157 / RJB 2259-6 / UBC 559-6) TaxID=578456 RepID=UPI0003F4995D|nr:uncharacterized protein TREMEDRAFT_66667 [Tremella mesenterica DSM 1558]EIW72004.1 hypothetical protein TREMEDRAFT_66667 [Tremella mesenterica DSM 1558]
MSLNSVVNSLVRAAASVPVDITDEELDKHVAQLLADEAKGKEEQWTSLGLKAYLGESSPDPNAPKPNKRFLASVIRTVDGHNASLLRAQEQAAKEVRRERSGGNGHGRLFGARDQRATGVYEEGIVERDDRGKREQKGEDRDEGGRKEASGRSERAVERKRRRHEESDEDEEGRLKSTSKRESRKRLYGNSSEDEERHSESRQDGRRHRTDRRREERTPKYDEHQHHEDHEHSTSYQHPHSLTLPPNPQSHPTPSTPPSSSLLDPPPRLPSPSPPPPRLSKMDKYFTPAYNPVLDVGEVPKEGLITAVGWDNMLAVLKERGKKRRQRSPGLFDDPFDIPKVHLRRSPEPKANELSKVTRRLERDERRGRREVSPGGAKRKEKEGGVEVMGWEYTKKGSVREWDVGK